MSEDPRLEKLKQIQAQAKLGGGQERIDRHHSKGYLTARERLDLLLDPGTFRELESLVVQQMTPKPRAP